MRTLLMSLLFVGLCAASACQRKAEEAGTCGERDAGDGDGDGDGERDGERDAGDGDGDGDRDAASGDGDGHHAGADDGGDEVTDDEDQDDDGFLDADDPDPLSASIPGDFSTPELILADPRVQAALAAADAAGFPIATATEREPPETSGYYLTPDLGSTVVATGDGTDTRRARVGNEARRLVDDDLVSRTASVSFTSNAPVAWAISNGNVVRGQGAGYTEYLRYKSTCTEEGSSFSLFAIGITSASVEEMTGDLVDQRSLAVTIATAGTLSVACSTRYAGNSEVEGGWSVVATPRATRIAVEDLDFMCVARDAAYVPTETWSGPDGASCSCSTEYESTCE